MGRVERIKAKVKFKKTEADALALEEEMHRVNEEMVEYRQDVKIADVENYSEISKPQEETTKQEVLPAQATLSLSSDDLAKIIAAAKGDYVAVPREPLPPDASLSEKVLDYTDEALGEVGRGAHRMVDGCRDILGGAIDIVTLGRAHRR